MYSHYLFSREALQTEILLQGLLPGRNCSVVLTADNFPLWKEPPPVCADGGCRSNHPLELVQLVPEHVTNSDLLFQLQPAYRWIPVQNLHP